MRPRIHRIEGNQERVYERPFHDFPLLTHHSHPYYVIVNAHSKFEQMSDEQIMDMPEEHRMLRTRVAIIDFLWTQLAPKPKKVVDRKGDEDEDEGDAFGVGVAYQHSGHQPRWKSAGREEKGAEDIDRIDRGNIGRTAAISHSTFSATDTTNSIAASPLNPPSLEWDSSVQPDDSASVISGASTGLRSGYKNEEEETRKDDTPMYRYNVDYWRKNILRDMDELPFLGEPMVL
jgi:hypothetical protein